MHGTTSARVAAAPPDQKPHSSRRRSVKLPMYVAPWSDNSSPTWSGVVSIRVTNTASALKEELALLLTDKISPILELIQSARLRVESSLTNNE